LVVKGKIEWISGPAVKASGMAASKMYEVVEVGEEKLVGEVIRLESHPGTFRPSGCKIPRRK